MKRPQEAGIFHAGGMDTLVGATRWVQSPAEQDDYMATEMFFVRDHLGSPVLALAAKKTLVSGETYRYELQPVESYEYDPYGQPTIHVPATDGSPQSAGRLALKSMGSFEMTGDKTNDGFLDRNDVGRPNGSSGNTWTRSGAVPVAQSALGWNYLFTGRAWDADVRQYYIRHRWYEPLTGRWTAVDPISYRGGLNQYQYCGGNGVCYVDRTGEEPKIKYWQEKIGENGKEGFEELTAPVFKAKYAACYDRVQEALKQAKEIVDDPLFQNSINDKYAPTFTAQQDWDTMVINVYAQVPSGMGSKEGKTGLGGKYTDIACPNVASSDRMRDLFIWELGNTQQLRRHLDKSVTPPTDPHSQKPEAGVDYEKWGLDSIERRKKAKKAE